MARDEPDAGVEAASAGENSQPAAVLQHRRLGVEGGRPAVRGDSERDAAAVFMRFLPRLVEVGDAASGGAGKNDK